MLGNSTDECWVIISERFYRNLDRRQLDNGTDVHDRRSIGKLGVRSSGSSGSGNSGITVNFAPLRFLTFRAVEGNNDSIIVIFKVLMSLMEMFPSLVRILELRLLATAKIFFRSPFLPVRAPRAMVLLLSSTSFGC